MTLNKLHIKKNQERHVLNNFLSAYELGIDTLKIIENETPDFIIQRESKKISIEISRLINFDIRKREEYQKRIIEGVAKKFKEKYNYDLYVLVTFSETIRLNGGEKHCVECVNEIFRLIEDIYILNKNYIFDITLQDKSLPIKYLKRLHLTNIYNHNHWQTFGAYLVDWINIEWLKECISLKEKNIKNYKSAFDENWLLLVANFGTKSSAHRFDFIDFKEIETIFERVFIYKYRENEVVIIK